MKEDVGMSKPKKQANKVGKLRLRSVHCKNRIVKITKVFVSTVERMQIIN